MNPWDILGWLGSVLLVFSLLQARVLRLRLLNLIACFALLIFNWAIDVWPMVAMNAVLCGINLYYLRKLMTERHDDTVFEVIQVRPDDEYLRHTLRVHASDILRFQPDFVWDQADPENQAFLVLSGDRTVGVVLLRADGSTARVQLDYVTPEYRDFSPGEFVWRKSRMLAENGFTTVVTPSRMVAPYYSRLGFREQGDSFVLDL